jgi:hypothetical protein
MGNIKRRTFVKRTAFSAVAISIFGQGIALANGGSSGSMSNDACPGYCTTFDPDDEVINVTANGEFYQLGKCKCPKGTQINSYQVLASAQGKDPEPREHGDEVKHTDTHSEDHLVHNPK